MVRSPSERSVGQRLPDRARWAIIEEWEKCKNMAKVARTLSLRFKRKLSFKRVKYWVDVYNKEGSVPVRTSTGRRKVLSTEAAREAVKLMADKEHFGTAYAAATELHKRGLTKGSKRVSNSTLIRAVRAQSKADGDELELACGRPGKALRETTKQQRLEFAEKHLNTNWAYVMFTDRCKFSFKYPGTKVKSKVWILKSKGGKHGNTCWQPNKPQQLNLYMGVTKFGVTKVHKVTGSHGFKSHYKTKLGKPARNITAHEYADVLDTFIAEGKRIFRTQGLSRCIVQQDNDPTHGSAAAKKVAATNASGGFHVSLLKWPPHSPDLSPIENVWGIVQRQVEAMGCPNFTEFEKAVVEKLQNFDRKTLEKMFKGMKGRMELVIKAKGDKIKY